MKKIAYSFALIGLIFLLGCNFPLLKSNIGSSSDISTDQMTLTLAAITPEGETPGMGPTVPCGYNWASRSLPAESLIFQKALTAAGIQFDSAQAIAFGETCTSAETLKVQSFGVMETDFRLSFLVDDLTDTDRMGDIGGQVIQVILSFAPDTFPGPNPGYVGLSFQKGAETQNLWFQLSIVKAAVLEGVKGNELYQLMLNH